MKICVIIPTYNEEENIKILTPLLFDKFKLFKDFSFYLVFVDGNSSDETVKSIKNLQKTFSSIHLIEEEKKSGLGGAYIKGYEYAMGVLQADYVVEMDADLQHNPADFPNLIKKIESNYDLIIGSRYIKGGSVPAEWNYRRKFISYFGSLFARVVLRMTKIKDFTSGFRVIKVKGILDQIDFSKLKSKGFAYKMDILVRIFDLKGKICEVPITFGLRDRGTSKMEEKNFQDSLKVILEFAAERNKNFIKFIVVGFGGLLIDYTLFQSLYFYFHFYDNAKIISGYAAMTFTFLMNNFFSFNERKKSNIRDLLLFGLIYFISSSIPIKIGDLIIDYSRNNYGNSFVVINVAFFIGIFFGLIWNFTVYSKIIWKRK
jgi:dolichol-phosphate mannosyltransferase